jgi:hypothetical protein
VSAAHESAESLLRGREHEHGDHDEGAAGGLQRGQRLAEHEEREQHRGERLDRREDRRRRRAGAPQAGEEQADRADRRDRGEAGDPAPPGGRQVARPQRAEQRGGDRERARRARADQRGERERRHARGQPVAHEDVRGVDDRGAEAERGAGGIERARPRAGHDERQPARREREGDEPARVRTLAAERDRRRGDQCRERVEEQRQQRRVDPLQRGEVAAGLERVRARAEREAGADVAARQARQAAAQRQQRPEQHGGEREADREQGPGGGALAVGELAEHGHGAERGGRRDAEEGSGGAHEPHRAAARHQERFRFLVLNQ